MNIKGRESRKPSRAARKAAAGFEKTMQYEQCDVCTYDITTGEGTRSCHWGACPYLPEELDVFCPTCNYDFFTREGNSECGDPPTCEYATKTAPKRVSTVKAWLGRHPHVTADEVLVRPDGSAGE